MNIGLVGSSGYIANFLFETLEKETNVKNIVKIDLSDEADIFLNLLSPENFNYELLDNIDIVIFTAAISSPDQCAVEFETCWKINVIGTSYFIKKAIEHNCKVLFFSSDAVFGNISDKIYTEKSETKANTAYGKMKKEIEDLFKNEPNFKAIRLSYVVSKKDKFVSYCLDCIKENKIAEIFHPFYRNCITISQVMNVVQWLINHWDKYEPFVLNVAGQELVSRVRIADEINRLYGSKLNYIISKPSKKFYENRPQITQMKSLYLEKYEILEQSTFTENLQREWGK